MKMFKQGRFVGNIQNLPRICDLMSCPVKEGRWMEIEVTHEVPSFISAFLDGDETVFYVIAKVKEGMKEIGCVKVDIVVKSE
jgi:hypothetical protein